LYIQPRNRNCGIGLSERDPVRLRIDGEQHIALLDYLVFVDVDRNDPTRRIRGDRNAGLPEIGIFRLLIAPAGHPEISANDDKGDRHRQHQPKPPRSAHLALRRGFQIVLTRCRNRRGRPGGVSRTFHVHLCHVVARFYSGIHFAALSADLVALVVRQDDASSSDKFSMSFNMPLTRLWRSCADRPASARSYTSPANPLTWANASRA